jgi:hypothetical protein
MAGPLLSCQACRGRDSRTFHGRQIQPAGMIERQESLGLLNANHNPVRRNVGRLLARRSHTIKRPRPLFVPVGAVLLTRYSMSDGRFFPAVIITAVIGGILIYAAFLSFSG